MGQGSESIKQHPRLLALMAGLLNGKKYAELAAEFSVDVGALEAYAQEAGIAQARAAEREKVGQPARKRQVRREAPSADSPSGQPESQPQRQREPTDAHLEERRQVEAAELESARLAEESYKRQPLGVQLLTDPMGPDFEFHVGFQPPERAAVILAQQLRERAEQRRQEQSPWDWGRERRPEGW